MKPDEAGLVFSLGVILLGNSVATQISGIVAISGFLSEGGGGSQAVLSVWVIDSLLILALAGIQSSLIDRFDRRTLTQGMTLGFALAFIGLRLLFNLAPGGVSYTLLYILSDIQWLFYPLVFWVFASEMFNAEQSKRVFPVIAGLGFVGKLSGIGIGAVSSQWLAGINFSSLDLILFNSGVYLALFLSLLAWKKGQIKPRPILLPKETFRTSLTDGWNFVRTTPAFRYLAVVIIAMLICDTVIEFRFLAVSDAAFGNPESYQTFYSLYRLGWVLAAIIIQTFVTNRLIEKVGIQNTLVILPLTALLSSVWMLCLPGIASAVGGTALLRLQNTVDDSARKSFQKSLVPAECRGRVSLFLDSILYGIGAILGCAVTSVATWLGTLVGLTSGDFYIYLGASLLAASVSLWAVIQMRKVCELS